MGYDACDSMQADNGEMEAHTFRLLSPTIYDEGVHYIPSSMASGLEVQVVLYFLDPS